MKPTMVMSMVTLVIWCLAWTQTNGSVVVENIHSNGLMFREMGYVYAYEESWKIMTVITREKFEKEEKFIKDRIRELKNLQDVYQNKNIGMVLNEFERLASVI